MTADLYRRRFLHACSAAAGGAALGWPLASRAQQKNFNPQPGGWRTFEVTTRVELAEPRSTTRIWLPVPSVNTDWQLSQESSFSSNGQARLASDRHEGVRMVYAEFAPGTVRPFAEVTSRVQTRNRADAQKTAAGADASDLRHWTRPTALVPTDGIVRDTARKAVGGASSDEEKVRRIYDWVVENTYREPKVRGCGEGDIKTMLETGNLGGKCADLNALFAGLCRSAGVPARDYYGLRVAPSAFGYRELGGNPASLKGAQHCRAEVYLKARGWVAMDPADVAKVMRQETPEWIKTTRHELVAPVNQALFGGWEGNWLAWNSGADIALPHSTGPKMGFFMYPVGENSQGRFDSYAPDDFKYQITAREITSA
ncbi:MAG: transglutaminase domain-containing protein [Burkholderiales bacterium]|nr:transglutaminase domain-containing protein [Burkholderiales bacterium]